MDALPDDIVRLIASLFDAPIEIALFARTCARHRRLVVESLPAVHARWYRRPMPTQRHKYSAVGLLHAAEINETAMEFMRGFVGAPRGLRAAFLFLASVGPYAPTPDIRLPWASLAASRYIRWERRRDCPTLTDDTGERFSLYRVHGPAENVAELHRDLCLHWADRQPVQGTMAPAFVEIEPHELREQGWNDQPPDVRPFAALLAAWGARVAEPARSRCTLM